MMATKAKRRFTEYSDSSADYSKSGGFFQTITEVDQIWEERACSDGSESCSDVPESSEDEWKAEKQSEVSSETSDFSEEERDLSSNQSSTSKARVKTIAIQLQTPSPRQFATLVTPEDDSQKSTPSGTSIRKHKSTPRNRKQKCNGRRRSACPVAGCTGQVVNMKRHFENIHRDIPAFEAENMIKNLKAKPKRSYPVKKCGFPDCKWVGVRPDKHLEKKHRLSHNEALEHAKTCAKVESSKSTNTKGVNAEAIADNFLEWFQSLEGGYFIPPDIPEHKKQQKQTQNKKIKYMVYEILKETFGEESFPIAALAQLKLIGRDTDKGEKKSVILRIKEGRAGKEPMTWGTVKNYLSAFSHFLDFLQACYSLHSLDIPGMRTVLRGIVHTVNKFVAEEAQRRKLQCREKVIPASLISKYFENQTAHKLLMDVRNKDKKGGHLTDKKTESVRNHLLLQTALSSGKRSGALGDMKCSQVFGAQTIDGERVVLIEDGKTFRTSGAAGIHFSSKDYKDLVFYMTHLRPKSTDSDQVFCQINGQHSTPSDINNFIQTAFNEFGMMTSTDVPHITCSLIRKTLVSIAREGDLSREEQLTMATHMDHTIDTADRIYDTSTGIKCTAKFSKIVDRFFQFEQDDDDDADAIEDLDIEQSHTLTHQPEPEKESSTSTCETVRRFGQPEVFSVDDRQRILRCCMPLIEKRLSDGGPLRREDVIEQVKSGGIQFQDLFTQYTHKQLYNRIRLELRKRVDKKKSQCKKK